MKLEHHPSFGLLGDLEQVVDEASDARLDAFAVVAHDAARSAKAGHVGRHRHADQLVLADVLGRVGGGGQPIAQQHRLDIVRDPVRVVAQALRHVDAGFGAQLVKDLHRGGEANARKAKLCHSFDRADVPLVVGGAVEKAVALRALVRVCERS